MRWVFVSKEFRSDNIKAETVEEAYAKLIEKFGVDELFYVVKPKRKWSTRTAYEERMIEEAAEAIMGEYDISEEDAKLAAGVCFDGWRDGFIEFVLNDYAESKMQG